MKPVPLKDWEPSLQDVIDDMNNAPLNVHSLMANHPRLLKAWWNLRNYLVNGGELGQRQGELVILRIAVHTGSWYEWASHVVRGIDSGLTLEEIERVRSGADDWSNADAALLQAVDEIAQKNVVGDETRARLREFFSEQQVMDVILLHGMYLTLACIINTWGLELDKNVRDRLPTGITVQSFAGQPG